MIAMDWDQIIRSTLELAPRDERAPRDRAPSAHLADPATVQAIEVMREVTSRGHEGFAPERKAALLAALRRDWAPPATTTDLEGGGEPGAVETATHLAQQLAAGDPLAFRQFFDRHFDRLCRYVHSYTASWPAAEDLIHDVFLKLWLRPQILLGARDLDAYLYAMARNEALNYLKRQRLEAKSYAKYRPSLRAGRSVLPPEAEAQLESNELVAAIQRAIDTLPPRQREVLMLRWKGEASYEQIGAALGIAPRTVAVHLQRAAEQLRKILPRFLG